MIRRVPAPDPIAEYELRTPSGTLRLRPGELCSLAETLEQWFLAHREQILEDVVEETLARVRSLRTASGSAQQAPLAEPAPAFARN